MGLDWIWAVVWWCVWVWVCGVTSMRVTRRLGLDLGLGWNRGTAAAGGEVIVDRRRCHVGVGCESLGGVKWVAA